MTQPNLLRKLAITGVAGAIGVITLQGNVQAALIGDEIFGCASRINDTCPTDNLFNISGPIQTVDPIAEFRGANLIFESFNADFSDGGFTLNISGEGFPSGLIFWNFEDLDWTDQPGRITDVALISGPDSNNVLFTFGDDFIRVQTPDVPNTNQTWEFSYEAEHGPSVPEPSTILGLFAIGGLGLGLKRSKQY